MLARCTHCESTFVTSEFGRQRCPKCRAEIVVDDPRPGAANPYTPPSAPAAPAAQPVASEPTQWERRAELGLWKALGLTISAVLAHPVQFFERLRYDNDDGATLYYVIVAVVPAIVAEVFTWASSNPAADKAQMAEALQSLSGAGFTPPPEMKNLIESVQRYNDQAATVQGLILSLIETPVYWLLLLFAAAGVSHLVLALLGRAKGGWPASFKVFAYAFTPALLMAIPSCFVGTIALTWATGLQILGLSKAHRISFTLASVGVIGFHIVALTCVGGGLAVAFSLFMKSHGLP